MRDRLPELRPRWWVIVIPVVVCEDIAVLDDASGMIFRTRT